MTAPHAPSDRIPHHGCDPKLLEFLVCPVTRGPLEFKADTCELVSRKAHLAYPIRDGVPLLTEEAARRLDD